jgi:hypothetical protein
MRMIAGYIIGFTDSSNEITLADPEDTPRVLYKTLNEAEIALKKMISKHGVLFTRALYGEVYPYENTTAQKELERTGRAVYGWIQYENEDDVRRVSICIISISWS